RRVFGGLALAAAAPAAAAENDTNYWRGVAAHFDKPRGVLQLENGNWGAMARPIRTIYEEHTRRVNRDTSYYARRAFTADSDAARARAAASLGVQPEELAFTRGATEALQALISGYNRLAPGDAVLLADNDYDAAQAALRWVAARRGVRVVE